MKLFTLLLFILTINANASVSFTNTTPNIPNGDVSIGSFTIEATITNTNDLDLGASFGFSIPNALPSMSMDDIDDGKLFVSYEIFDINESKYVSSPGLRISINDRNISIKVVSVLYALEKTINHNTKKVSLSKGDFIKFTLSASKDIRNVANVKFQDTASLSFYSSDINIIDKSNTINTPARLISIDNPAVNLAKSGLGANTNLELKFDLKEGIPENTRLEIEFPEKFNITQLANFTNNVYINNNVANKKNYINNQKLSFIVENAIKSNKLELLILGNHIVNPIIFAENPFSLKIFLKGNGYDALYKGNKPTIEQVYYNDKDSNEKYSLGDKIIIKFYKKILISSFIQKKHFRIEKDINGSTFGHLYGLSAIDGENGYSSNFAITLGNDFNISKDLIVTIDKFAPISVDGVIPSSDITFKIPSYYKSYFNNTIDLQYDKLYAKNDIDMLHNTLSHSTPTHSSTNSLKIKDEDNSATYSKGDSLSIEFSSPVKAIKILDKSSIYIPFSDTSLGDDFSIELNEQRILKEDFYAKYKIILGTNPKIKPNSQFSFLKDMISSKNGSNALSDILFSGFPTLTRPDKASNNIYFEDKDRNGLYSSGDRIILKFNQNIAPLNISKIKVSNSKFLDAQFISTKTSKNGYSSQYSIKLGDDTNITKGDTINISKANVINAYGVKAGLANKFIKFNVVDIIIPKIKDISFNYANMQALIEVSTPIYENNPSSIEDNILIFARGVKKSIKEWGLKYEITDISLGSKIILIDFEDNFLNKIGSNVFDFIIKNKAFKSAYDITNDRFAKTFYRSTRLIGLIPEAWNLVAIQDNGTDTNIKNMLKTNKILKIWVFDEGEWHLKNKNIKRGDGFWIVPKRGVKGIENIEGIKAINPTFKSSLVFNTILDHDSNQSLPLGNSMKDCDNIEDKILISDILYNNTKDKNITIFLFDADNSKWIKNKDIFPCEGFLVSITGNL